MMSLLGAMGCHRWTPPPLQEQPFPAVCSSTPTVRFFPVSLWTASGVEVLFALVEGFSDTLVTAPVAAYVDGLHEQPTAVATLTGEGVRPW